MGMRGFQAGKDTCCSSCSCGDPAYGLLDHLAGLQSKPTRLIFPEGCLLTGNFPQADLVSMPVPLGNCRV